MSVQYSVMIIGRLRDQVLWLVIYQYIIHPHLIRTQQNHLAFFYQQRLMNVKKIFMSIIVSVGYHPADCLAFMGWTVLSTIAIYLHRPLVVSGEESCA